MKNMLVTLFVGLCCLMPFEKATGQSYLNRNKRPSARFRVQQNNAFDRTGHHFYYPFADASRYSVELSPLVIAREFNHYWNTPDVPPQDGNKGVFRNNRWINRQFSLTGAVTVSPSFIWSNGNRGWFQGRFILERQAFQLNGNYQYFIGKEGTTSANVTTPGEILPLLSSDGISMERTMAATVLELVTARQGLLSLTVGGGVCYQHTGLKTRKDVDYMPWSVGIRFRDAFKNDINLRPIVVLGAQFGGRVFISANLRFYPLAAGKTKQYQLYYAAGPGGVPGEVPAAPQGRWGYSGTLGIGVRW